MRERERQGRTVREHMGGQRGGWTHLVEGETRLVTVERVGGRWSTQT